MQAQMDIQTLWGKVVDQVKHKVIHPTLWRTLEVTVPIVTEDGEFVVGLAPGDYHMSGHMNTSEHRNAIETALREFSGVTYKLRVIEGNTIQDWQQVRAKDQSMQALKDAAYRKREADSAVTKSWDGLLETAGRKYAALPLRQLPQFRAQYVAEMIQIISETMDVLTPEGTRRDELAERTLARVIDRVATLTETPATWIALELYRYRSGKR